MAFENLSFKTKLVSAFLFIGILSIVIIGWQGYQLAKMAIEERTFEALTATRDIKKRQVENYFEQVKNQITTLSENYMIVDAMKQLTTAFHNVKEDYQVSESRFSEYAESVRRHHEDSFAKKYNKKNPAHPMESINFSPPDAEGTILQHFYVANNGETTHPELNQEAVGANHSYHLVHSKYHPALQSYQEKFRFYDIFLVDEKTGHIVYSVRKEIDFATSLLTGPHKDSNIANTFRDAREASQKDFVKLSDFELYGPSFDAPSLFIASPVFDGGKKTGVLVFQISISEIDRVITGEGNWEEEGLGKTGETYIVGSDYKPRSNCRFLLEKPEWFFDFLGKQGSQGLPFWQMKEHSTTVLFWDIMRKGITEALSGISTTKMAKNCLGLPSLSSYAPLKIHDVQWVILSEITAEEAFASVNLLRNRILWIGLFIVGLIIILGMSISKTISSPLLRLIKSSKQIGEGDLSRRVDITSKDEIGVLAESFNQMAVNLKKTTVSKGYVDNLFASMMDALLVITPTSSDSLTCSHSIITKVNRSTSRMLGYSEEELIGMACREICAATMESHQDCLAELDQKGVISESEKLLLAKNGRKIPVLFSSSLIHSQNGKPPEMICVAHDITHRKQAEHEVNQFKTTLDMTLDCVFMFKPGSLRFFYLNQGSLDHLGYTREELLGMTPLNLQPEFTEGTFRGMLARLLNKAVASLTFETIFTHKNGTQIPVEVFMQYIEPQDEEARFVAVVRDISKRKEREMELQKAKNQAEEATKLKDKFVSLVAHDLKSPFTSILGFLRLIHDDQENPLCPKHKELLKRSMLSGNRLVSMIEELLKIGRFRTGKITLQPRFINGNSFTKFVIEQMALMPQEKGIKLINEVPEKMRLFADFHLLHEVFANLLGNAVKFSDTGDKIKVFVPEGRETTIAVQDYGTGISEKAMPNLFRQDIHTTTKGTRGERGSGLGLPYCKEIVSTHGGEITVESTVGKGSTFYVQLPMVKPKVLIVDDEPPLRSLIKAFIEDINVECIEAENGKMAMDMVEQFAPNLVITDLFMPEVDGFKLIDHIRKSSKSPTVPIIAITTDQEMEARNKAFRIGASDFVIKPLAMEDLNPRVQRFVGCA